MDRDACYWNDAEGVASMHEQHRRDQVVFLDFTDGNFDGSEVIEPTLQPNRRFWEQTHEIALDDLAALVAPDQIVICEGKHGDGRF